MLKTSLNAFALLLVLLCAGTSGNGASQPRPDAAQALTGTLQKMIVENASVTIQLDLNGLNVERSLVARPIPLHFAAAPNSFFSILVFNDSLRGIQPGSMALALQNSSSSGVIPFAKATADKTPPVMVICLRHYAHLLSG